MKQQPWIVSITVLLSACHNIGSSQVASVVWDQTKLVVVDGIQDNWVARGNFTDLISTTGWSYLTVTTNDSYSDRDQAFAAGQVEGYLTSHYIKLYWDNVIGGYCQTPTQACKKVNGFLNKNNLWMLDKMQNYGKMSYWHQVYLIFQQLLGMEDAYYKISGRDEYKGVPTQLGLLMLQIGGDLEDLESIVGVDTGLKRKHPVGSGSCSALIKLLPGYTDLLASHVTWDEYNGMMRIVKKYDFGFHVTPEKSAGLIPGKEMAFTSYPGVLTSQDDFYVTGRKLVALETTIGNTNKNLWAYSTYENLLEWVRSLVAMRLAESGLEWVELFKQHNMGTYNNQWMIVDYSKFIPGRPPADGCFTVVEQIPGSVKAADLSREHYLMKNSYWASYNIPYFSNIYTESGWPEQKAKYGDWFDYSKNPRAQIFKRDQGKIHDVPSMLKVMRYNDFQHDPLSRCNCTPPYSAENGISARSDLNPANGSYPFGALGHRCHGGTDAKVISSSMVPSLSFLAVSGPTFDQQPPFRWSTSDFNGTYRHEGLPDLWMFEPVNVTWNRPN